MIDGAAALTAGLASFLTGASLVIGALVTWRKAADERTVAASAASEARAQRAQATIDYLRRRERILTSYIYRLHRQILALGGDPDPWPTQLDEPTPGGHP